MVRTQIDRLAWDRQMYPNPHALAIYLKFVPTWKTSPKGFKSVNVKTTMFIFTVELRFPVMAIIVAYEAQWTHFSWSIESNT